ncbi:DUF6262 family protein [Peribacillus simplex]|uniref:Tn554-related, transposase C n=1 Tax=Peribacillus simplex TaxID=1478 RepID=A0AAN2TQA3_9BACI|nr:DUF6262 family protein [Peribacillus simplex]CEG25018.1 Tn554-related, transposase C [Peribacillus simplex]CRH88097.1 Uncharacterised protein [Chlamydia trachomatis]
MPRYDRKEHLKEIHSKRRALTTEKVEQAIKKLMKSNNAINFNSVAIEAGVSKATLYNNKDIREQISTLRSTTPLAYNKKQAKSDLNDNNKDAVIDSLRRRIKKLEEENKELRNNLKVAYSDYYKNV